MSAAAKAVGEATAEPWATTLRVTSAAAVPFPPASGWSVAAPGRSSSDGERLASDSASPGLVLKLPASDVGPVVPGPVPLVPGPARPAVPASARRLPVLVRPRPARA